VYGPAKRLLLRVLRVPSGPPEPPAGSPASLAVFRASPRFFTYRQLGLLLVVTLFWLGWWVMTIAAIAEEELAAIVVAALLLPLLFVLQLVVWFLLRVDYELRYYAVTDRSLRVRQGALIVKELTLTYANVQNLRVTQGPLMKLFGLWDLRVDTAGGGAGEKGASDGSHTAVLAGIENAHAVRDLVLGHLKALGAGAGTGLGDLDERGHARGPLSPSAALSGALRDLRDAAAALRMQAERGSSPAGRPSNG
jgi:membrane protein YdbS with pleckstrin-like domain